MNSHVWKHPKTAAACAYAAIAATIPLVAASSARADDVDKSNPRPAAVAPVAPQEPALDFTNGWFPDNGFEPRTGIPQRVEADIDVNTNANDYLALVLDSDGTDNLYIKVQQQDGGNKFDHIGFYHGAHGGGWSGMTGGAAFFAIPAADQFNSAHMVVLHDGNGNVTLRFDSMDGGGRSTSYTRGGWTPRMGAGAGFGGWNGYFSLDNWGASSPPGQAICDNFNRANGALGADWVTNAGSGSIVNNSARGDNLSRSIFVGTCYGGISQSVEADVTVNGSTGLDYCALVFNYDGTNNLYVKVQQQEAGGQFDHIGFYDSINGSGWPGENGGSGFFSIPAAQRFSSAHMQAILYPGGTVRLIFTNIDGGSDMQEYQRGGWTYLVGSGAGMGGFNGLCRMDNFAIGGLGICDRFNRPNTSSTLGPNWTIDTGSARISGFAAANGRSSTASRAIFTGQCGQCLDTTPPFVNITSPGSFSCACNSVTISGTVNDTDGMYTGDELQYRALGTLAWTTVDSNPNPRSGVLYVFNTAALVEGYYEVRVVAMNDCGLSNTDNTLIYIGRSFDSAVLRSPGAGNILGGVVCFDGSAWDNNCFLNYSVEYRAVPAGGFAPVDPAFPTYNSYVINDPLASWNTASGPTAVPDGDYEVRLTGRDQCGNTAVVTRAIRVDNTAPISVITAPVDCSSVNGVVQIRGTARDANLAGWVVQYSGGGSHGWVTIASGNTNVVNGTLANWNTSALPRCAYTLRLVVGDQAGVNCSGNNHQAEYHVSVNLGLRCDFNGDGLCDGDDVQLFVNCLLGFGCP